MSTPFASRDDAAYQRGLIADILAALVNGPGADSLRLTTPAAPDAESRRLIINGPIILTGVQNIEQLYDELQAEARRRNVGGVG